MACKRKEKRERKERQSQSRAFATISPLFRALCCSVTDIVDFVVVVECDGVVELKEVIAERKKQRQRQEQKEKREEKTKVVNSEAMLQSSMLRARVCLPCALAAARCACRYLSIRIAFSYAEHAFSKSSSRLSVMPRYM